MPTLELTTNLLVEIGGWPALKEARGLVERGRVSQARREGDVVRASVQGAEKVYEPQIILADRVANVEVRCTCAESRRSGRVCAHALAAGLALLQPAKARVAVTGPATESSSQRPPQPKPVEGGQIIFSRRSDGAMVLRGLPVPRVIPHDQIADFLSREFPALERSCELVFAPGFEEFRLEIGRPTFEARLEGALPGLTLELMARYEEKEFALNGKTDSSAFQRYVPDAREPNRFWRRNIIAEREALVQVEAAGFSLVRSGAAAFSLISENVVARFLANTLPRWRRAWTIRFGPRLEATMADIDVAQPEFSLRRRGPGAGSGEDWLSLDLKLSVQGKPVPLDQAEIQRWLQTGQSHARTANQRVLLVPTEAWSEMKEVLADCEVDQEPGKIRIGRTFAPYLTGALTAQGFRAGENAAADFSPPEVKTALDAKLWGQLRPYQAQGVEWLAALAQQGFHGLLADDMGLGKTLQALAFCAWVRAENEELRTKSEEQESESNSSKFYAPSSKFSPSLVVCPTSLVTNWLREAARFTPHLRALDLTGADRAEKFAKRKEYDLLVTSYAILRRDVEHYRAEEFSLVILDEAQHIKNRSSQNAQGAKALRARHRLILTGTPLENSVLDLWSLYDFLLPGYLGTAADFRERYETPLIRGPEPKLMARLRHRVRPFFLRRTKAEVLTELPPKLEFPTLCELTDEQRKFTGPCWRRGVARCSSIRTRLAAIQAGTAWRC